MLIGGLQKTTLTDFPGKISAIVFTVGCNFRCGYCHNPELYSLKTVSKIAERDVLSFLEKRKAVLEGVVITGGEPTLQNDLAPFIRKIKKMGYLVKLDTNGSKPDVVARLLKNKLLDYIAMDIKSPLDKYKAAVKRKIDTAKIKKSIDLIILSGIDYEFRTTVVRGELDENDLIKIGGMIKGAKLYALQKFVPSKVYDKKFYERSSYSQDELDLIKDKLKNYVSKIIIR